MDSEAVLKFSKTATLKTDTDYADIDNHSQQKNCYHKSVLKSTVIDTSTIKTATRYSEVAVTNDSGTEASVGGRGPENVELGMLADVRYFQFQC